MTKFIEIYVEILTPNHNLFRTQSSSPSSAPPLSNETLLDQSDPLPHSPLPSPSTVVIPCSIFDIRFSIPRRDECFDF